MVGKGQLKTAIKKTVKKIAARGRYMSRFGLAAYAGGLRPVITAEWQELLFDAVNIDINNTCNLRCRFCFNTFEAKHVYMTPEIFRRILPVISLTRKVGKGGTGVYLSCLYEPSLSPHFLTFLDMLPAEGRKKVFFTSNFCRPWQPEQLARILGANLHHINISMETLQKDRYEAITSSKHFDSFYKNVHTLAALYGKKNGYRPRLRYITMVLRMNLDEIPYLLRYCRRKLHASQHELRTPYISIYENMDWNRGQMLDAGECERLKRMLAATWIPMVTDIHPRDDLVMEETVVPETETTEEPVEETCRVPEPVTEAASAWCPDSLEEELAFCMHQEFFFLRFHPDGTCTENVTKFTCPLPEQGDLEEFYRQKLLGLHAKRCAAFLCREQPDLSGAEPVKMRVMVESLVCNEAGLTVRGWCRADMNVSPETILAVCLESSEEKKKTFCYVDTFPRPDLAGKAAPYAAGFVFCAAQERLAAVSELTFLFVNRKSGKAAAYYHYPYRIRQKIGAEVKS